MGSTNALLKYKQEDVYNQFYIEKGKYDKEIVELDYGHAFILKAIFPKRPFCFIKNDLVFIGNEKACIVEVEEDVWDFFEEQPK
jgi:hypothetical protein